MHCLLGQLEMPDHDAGCLFGSRNPHELIESHGSDLRRQQARTPARPHSLRLTSPM
jgi:hypothetical protein